MKALFSRAVTTQQQAVASKDLSLMKTVVSMYLKYLSAEPTSGVALNNLARAYEDLGEAKAAADCYRKAIALNDSNRLFYMTNYARALAKAGDWKAAAPVYRALVREQPQASAPHAALTNYYLSTDLTGLLGYLWERLNAGQPERACVGALEALVKLPGKADTALLTLVAAGLGRMAYEPTRLPGLEIGKALTELSSAPDGRGECATQILKVHAGPGKPSDYSCWRYRDQRDANGITPGEAFQTLIRGIAGKYRAMGDTARATGSDSGGKPYDIAAQYLRLALDLNDGMDVDPVAFDELVRLEVGRDNLKAVAGLSNEYEQKMLNAKAAAYAQQKDERIYQFHRALGEMYAVLGVSGSSTEPQSAIFQLERARATSEKLEKNDAKAARDYGFTPEMTNLLVSSYKKAGRPASDAWRLRLEQAERYEKAGDRDAVEEVIKPVRDVEPPPELKVRYDTVLKRRGVDELRHHDDYRRSGDLTVIDKGTADIHVHHAKDLEVRFDARERADLGRLSAAQREQLYTSLQAYLEQARVNPKAAWSDAPAGVKSVSVDAAGRGTLTMLVEGKPVEVRFQVMGKVTPTSWTRARDLRREKLVVPVR